MIKVMAGKLSLATLASKRLLFEGETIDITKPPQQAQTFCEIAKELFQQDA